MAYIQIALNHFREMTRCAQRAGVEVKMDCATFSLEAKGRGRYFSLYPQFMVRVNGQIAYTQSLEAGNAAFIGWLPYRPISWREVSDKRLFKQLVLQNGLRAPGLVDTQRPAEVPFLIKQSAGSFGYGLDGPFRASERPAIDTTQAKSPNQQGQLFAEEFIPGAILKVWFWGEQPFFAHQQDFAQITGVGSKTVRELVEDRLARIGERFSGQGEQQAIVRSLKFQDVELDEVLPEGRTAWIDYRYGRTYESTPPSAVSDSVWGQLSSSVRSKAEGMGKIIGRRLTEHFGAPVLCAVDAIVDGNAEVWWLEANTNPMVPPEAYAVMFDTLFGVAAATERATSGRDQSRMMAGQSDRALIH